MLPNRILLLCLTVLLVLAGCKSAPYDQTIANVADVKIKADQEFKKSNQLGKLPPPLVVNQGPYVDKTPISLARQPEWLQNRIVLRGEQLPFSYYSRTIAAGGGRAILTRYQVGLDDKTLVSMNYSGTVKGALDVLATKTGYVYAISGSNVYWQAFVTRTFDIAFMPGSSDYMMGKASGGSGPSASAVGGAAGGGTPTVTGIVDDSASSQYSNLKGTLSVWKDLEASIKQLLSPDGKVMVSEATTTVTVRDRPTNIALIAQFINNLNNNLSKQVLVKIQVLDVTLENDYNVGINWNIVQGAFGNGTYQLNANNGTPISITSVTGLTSSAGGAAVGLNNQNILNNPTEAVTGVIALINALKQQGKVSVVTEPRVLCQNNQVSTIRIVRQTGYLASIQTTSFSGSTTGAASVTSQITPGSLVTGVTVYVLPKIMGNRVYLQVNADLSTSQGITTITSTGAAPSNTPQAGTSVIQVPNVTQKQFNQRSVIGSGDTLILSGFRQVSNQGGAAQLFDSQALGGKTSQEITIETIVLITPIILHGSA